MKRISKVGLTSFIVLISSLIVVIILISFSFIKNAESANEIANTWEIKNTIRRVSSSISAMESSGLAYAYTNQIKYKHAFISSQEDYDSLLLELKHLLSDSPEQMVRVKAVEEEMNKNFSIFQLAITSSDTIANNTKAKLENQKFLSNIQLRLEALIAVENIALKESNNKFDRWKVIIILSLGVAVIIVFLSLYNLINRIRPLIEELLDTQRELEKTNSNLQTTLLDLQLMNVEKEKEIKAKEEAIQDKVKLNESLLTKNQQLDHFAYVASHDLQEPLRTVSNYLEIFQEDFPERLEGDATMYFDFINKAVERMRKLIKGLLSYSRIGTSGDMESVDLNKTLKKIKADFEYIIDEQSIVIESDDLPTVVGHKLELKQLFQNIISNAIKFSKEGITPHIKITFQETDNYYNFHIEDNGIGIHEKDFMYVPDIG